MTKDDLMKYKRLKREAKQACDQMNEILLEATSPAIPRLTGMPHGSGFNSDKIADAIQRYGDAAQIYAEKVNALTDELYYIEGCISKLKDPDERTLLRLRYIRCMRWEDICEEMTYEWAQIHRKHRRALQHILPIN